jgi:hypothetical protein
MEVRKDFAKRLSNTLGRNPVHPENPVNPVQELPPGFSG